MIEIRPCRGFEELQACVDLEIETWGYDPTDLVPKKTFLLAQKVGGQVIGAFHQSSESESDTPHLVGFAMAAGEFQWLVIVCELPTAIFDAAERRIW